MVDWPQISDPLLLERLAMSDPRFEEFFRGLLEAVGSRELRPGHYESAIGYPWPRPAGSYLLRDGVVEELDSDRAAKGVAAYLEARGDRQPPIPLLAYGSNGSPERLAVKFAHLPDGDRDALIVAGRLTGFDIGASALAPVWKAMAATLFPSPGTTVRIAVLFVTPAQLTALSWTELSYRLGALDEVDITLELDTVRVTRVFAYVSRFGTFCVEGAPVAMAAVGAEGRTARALTQVEILDSAAEITLGRGATARDLIKAAFEEPAAFVAEHYRTFRSASVAFESDRWTGLPVSTGTTP